MLAIAIFSFSMITTMYSPAFAFPETPDEGKGPAESLRYPTKDIDGKTVDFANKTKGKVVLIVNVASECGYTPQYEGLQKLHEKLGEKGLILIGVPSNDFGAQEPGSNQEIRKFCSSKYKVTFDMVEKAVVKGKEKCPLYQDLSSGSKAKSTGGEVKWNFTKFLVNKKGEVIQRFEPNVDPLDEKLVGAIEKALSE